MKPIVWIGSSLDDLKAFPDSARQCAGYQLGKIQHGELPDDWKPMGSIGIGVAESRISDAAGAFRVIFIARFGHAIYVLHAPEKVPEDVVARRRSRAKAPPIDTR